jgi:hypothetical protein
MVVSIASCRAEPDRSADADTARFAVSFFEHHGAKSKREELCTLTSLQALIQETTAQVKSELPWLKLARFGTLISEKGSLRTDDNLLVITGIEADYDGETFTFDKAAELVLKAGLRCLIYTSPSYTENTPRWRLLCPTSEELSPDRRDHLMGRLNGLFGGIFSAESWTKSQSYFFGSVRRSLSHQVEVFDGLTIDRLDELDVGWLGKPGTGPVEQRAGAPLRSGPIDENALTSDIVTGTNIHQSSIRLLGHWARSGVAMMDARTRLQSVMATTPEPQRDARWHTRCADIDRCVEWVYGREAAALDRGERSLLGRAQESHGDVNEVWLEPVDFLADAEMTGLPVLRSDHLPRVIYDFAVDTAERMGVDPLSVGMAAVISCCSVMHETWRIQPKQHDSSWTEEARLWFAIVGDPSVLKSPVIAACTRPVEKLDADARKAHGAALKKHKADMAAWKRDGADADIEPAVPLLDRYIVEGTTVEALSEILRDDAEAKQRAPAGRVLVRQDEMSEFVAGFDRYRSGGRGGADRGAYLRLYNGGRYVVDRIGRGTIAISHWSGCILGGIQPEPIQRIAREAADDGLLQRFLYVVPGTPGRGLDRSPNMAAVTRYHELFPALTALLPPRSDKFGMGSAPITVVLHAGAHRHRHEIDDLIAAVAALPDTSNRLKASLGKWRGTFARLCLAFHLIEAADANARGDECPFMTVLSEATAKRVASLMREALLPHLLRAEALMFSTAQTGHTRWIAGFILSRGHTRISLRDVVQAYGPLRAPEARRELLDVMESLVVMAWLRPEPQANPARTTTAWEVNPAVHKDFAARAASERDTRNANRQVLHGRLVALTRGKP